MMQNSARRELLEDAKEALEMAIENIRQAGKGTKFERQLQPYILGHLQSWIDGRETVTVQMMLDEFGGGEDDED